MHALTTSHGATTTPIPALARTSSPLFWTLEGLLALLFLFAGGMKLVVPVAE
jgi:hypothetical protein